MKLPEFLFLIINPMMRILLRSPLHLLMSKSLMLISFKGRKSGRVFTTPVRYIRQQDTIQCFTAKSNQWWRNVAADKEIVIRVEGKDYACRAEVVTDDHERVRQAIEFLLDSFPADAPYYEIRMKNGQPDKNELEQASRLTALVETTLTVK